MRAAQEQNRAPAEDDRRVAGSGKPLLGVLSDAAEKERCARFLEQLSSVNVEPAGASFGADSGGESGDDSSMACHPCEDAYDANPSKFREECEDWPRDSGGGKLTQPRKRLRGSVKTNNGLALPRPSRADNAEDCGPGTLVYNMEDGSDSESEGVAELSDAPDANEGREKQQKKKRTIADSDRSLKPAAIKFYRTVWKPKPEAQHLDKDENPGGGHPPAVYMRWHDEWGCGNNIACPHCKKLGRVVMTGDKVAVQRVVTVDGANYYVAKWIKVLCNNDACGKRQFPLSSATGIDVLQQAQKLVDIRTAEARGTESGAAEESESESNSGSDTFRARDPDPQLFAHGKGFYSSKFIDVALFQNGQSFRQSCSQVKLVAKNEVNRWFKHHKYTEAKRKQMLPFHSVASFNRQAMSALFGDYWKRRGLYARRLVKRKILEKFAGKVCIVSWDHTHINLLNLHKNSKSAGPYEASSVLLVEQRPRVCFILPQVWFFRPQGFFVSQKGRNGPERLHAGDEPEDVHVFSPG